MRVVVGHRYTRALELLHADLNLRHQESLIAGTMFQQTKKPLREWFLAIFYVSASKGGVSAAELQRLLGMGSYQTAWSWLHKIRQAMVHPRRRPLSGEVEIDESYLGAPQSGKRGRGAAGKTIVAGAVEKRGKGSGRVRLGVLENVRAETLKAFLSAGVSPTTTAHTDGWRGYSKLDRSGYRHVVSVIHGSSADGVAHLPRVHLVFSLLKRWLLGTHHGAISTKHLPAYLEEYTFRFNRRTARPGHRRRHEQGPRARQRRADPVPSRGRLFGRPGRSRRGRIKNDR